jgi:hypothetical protein
MADSRKPHENPFFTRQSGLTYGDEGGAIKGYDDVTQAQADIDDRNARAATMGLTARYEIVKTG